MAEFRATPGIRAGRAAIVSSVRALGPLRRPVADAIAIAWYISRPAAERRRAARNHQRLNPALDARAAQRLARRSYRAYVQMIFESIWADSLTEQEIRRRIELRGREHLPAAGKGAVLAISHFGNWDVAASGAVAFGLRLTTVMADIIGPSATAMVALSRQAKGLELYTPRQAARGLVRALRRGRVVALMADVPEAGPTVDVPYCGGVVRFSAVPARLASSLDVALLPVACWREGGRWVVQVEAPIREREADDAAVMSRVARALEPAVRRHPEQWYPFHEVYVDRPTDG